MSEISVDEMEPGVVYYGVQARYHSYKNIIKIYTTIEERDAAVEEIKAIRLEKDRRYQVTKHRAMVDN